MTLDDAIKHCQQVAKESDCECANEHKQLVEWLKELKKFKQKQTNEDWIKQCTTEQLAEWLQEHMDCASCGCNKDLCYQGYDCCKLAFIEWLKQPHKDGEA